MVGDEVERINRQIEAGEKLGFLPGDLVEKINPYLRPLYDALHDMLDYTKVQEMDVQTRTFDGPMLNADQEIASLSRAFQDLLQESMWVKMQP